MRASDVDRDAAAERLRQAATEGRLAPDELDERLSRAFAAVTYGDLDTLVDDLPVPVPSPPPSRLQRADFGRRFAAWVIDGVVVLVMLGILARLLHGVGGGLALLASAGYFTVFEGGPSGAALGKQAMGLRVVDARSGERIGYPRALWRWFARFISAIPFYLGYLWMLGDRNKQCWHDKLAGDLVVFSDGHRELSPGRGARRDPARLPPKDWY